MVYVIVKGPRICSRRYEHHHERAFLRFIVRLLNPLRKLSAVWRIAKYPFAPPNLARGRPPPW